MLCRCARLVIRKGAGFAGTSTGSRTTPRLRPPVPCSSIMTSDSNVRERQAIFSMSSSYGRFVHRAHMSALAEESGVEGREDGPPTVPLMPMHLRSLSEQGSAGARRCRKAGYTPGVVYSTGEGQEGRGGRLMVKTNTKFVNSEIRRLESSFESTVYRLVIEDSEVARDGEGLSPPTESNMEWTDQAGSGELVFPNEVRLHPVRFTLLSINFIRYKSGRRHAVPIRYVNEDLNVNIKKGAIIFRLKTHQYIILPDDPADVPQWLDLDLQHVRTGNKLRVRDIMLPSGISLFRGNEDQVWDEVICTVKGKKSSDAETEDMEDKD